MLQRPGFCGLKKEAGSQAMNNLLIAALDWPENFVFLSTFGIIAEDYCTTTVEVKEKCNIRCNVDSFCCSVGVSLCVPAGCIPSYF